mmetsp:Transcript_41865/g.90382  ORF Transcript_41865/g.90382 Transcript_41865/m.90382 type:complete len:863 (-) Transcript_41865:77-2665(-)
MFTAAVLEEGVEFKLTHHPVRAYSPSGFPVDDSPERQSAGDKPSLLQYKQQSQQELRSQLSSQRLFTTRRSLQQPQYPATRSLTSFNSSIHVEPVANSKGIPKASQVSVSSPLKTTYQGTTAVSSASVRSASPVSMPAMGSPMSQPDCLAAPTPQKAFSWAAISRMPLASSSPIAPACTGPAGGTSAARPLVRQSLSLTALPGHDRSHPKQQVSTSLAGVRASKGAIPPPVSLRSAAGAKAKQEPQSQDVTGHGSLPAARQAKSNASSVPVVVVQRPSPAIGLVNPPGSIANERSSMSEKRRSTAPLESPSAAAIRKTGGNRRAETKLPHDLRQLGTSTPTLPTNFGEFSRSTPSASSSSLQGSLQRGVPQWKALTSDSESVSLARRLAVLTPAHPWGQDLGAGLLMRGLQLIFDDLRKPRPDLDAATLRVMTWDFERRRGVLPAGWQANPALSARCAQHLAMLLLSEENGEAVSVPVVAGISLPVQVSELESEEGCRADWVLAFEGCDELVQRARQLWPGNLGIADELFRLADPHHRGRLSSALGEVEHYADLAFQALQLDRPRCPAAVWYQLVCACSDDSARELPQSQAEDLVQWLLECIASSLPDDSSPLQLRFNEEEQDEGQQNEDDSFHHHHHQDLASTASSPLEATLQSLSGTVNSVSPTHTQASPAPSAVLVLRLGQKLSSDGPSEYLAPILSSREEEESSDWQSRGAGPITSGRSEASPLLPASDSQAVESDLEGSFVSRRGTGRRGSPTSKQANTRQMQEVVSFADEFEVEGPLPAPRNRPGRPASRTPSPDKKKGVALKHTSSFDRDITPKAAIGSFVRRDVAPPAGRSFPKYLSALSADEDEETAGLQLGS